MPTTKPTYTPAPPSAQRRQAAKRNSALGPPKDFDPTRRSSTARTAQTRQQARSERIGPRNTLRVGRLYLVRESDRNALTEFGKMIKLILLPHAGQEFVDRMLGHGADVMERTIAGERLRRALGAEPVLAASGRLVGYLFVAEDRSVAFFYALASASETNLGGTNDFCDAFAATVRALRPERLTTGPPNRLIRVQAHAVTIKAAAVEVGAVIECLGKTPMDMTNPLDQFMWEVEGWLAEGEYRSIVGRLTNGELDTLMAGVWPKTADHAPFGYVADDSTKSGLIFDPDCFPTLWHMIKLAAQPGLDEAAIAQEMGSGFSLVSPVATARALRAASRAHPRTHDETAANHENSPDDSRSDSGAAKPAAVEPVTIDKMRYPGAAIRNRLAHLETYRTGWYRYFRRVQVPHEAIRVDAAAALTDRDGEPLPEDNYLPNGEYRVEPFLIRDLELGPVRRRQDDGTIFEGWTDEELIVVQEAIRLRASGASPSSRRSGRKERRPFTLLPPWEVGERQRIITGERADLYTVRERPKESAADPYGTPLGWRKDGTSEGTMLFRFGAEIHIDFATRVINAFEADGIEPIASSVNVGGPDQARTDWVRNIGDTEGTIERAKTRLKGARECLADARGRGEVEEVSAQQELIDDTKASLVALRSQLDVMRSAEPPSTIAVATEANVGGLRAVLAELLEARHGAGGRVVPRVPAHIANHLAAVLSSFRVQLSANGLRVEWSATLKVQTREGYRTVGPITGSVPRHGYTETDPTAPPTEAGHPATRSIVHQRRRELLRAHLADGGSLADTAATVASTDTRDAARQIRDQLMDVMGSKGLRSALVDCPAPEARRVIWAHLTEKTEPLEGIDPAYAQLIRTTYLVDDAVWTTSWAGSTHDLERRAVTYTAAATDPEAGVRNVDLITALGLNPDVAQDRARVARLSTWTPSQGRAPDFAPVLERVPYRDRQGRMTTEWTRWTAPADTRVRLRWCDTCEERTATHILRVPEVPQGVLCPTCRHMPTDRRSEFPASYFRNWSGPRGDRRAGALSGTFEAGPASGPARPPRSRQTRA